MTENEIRELIRRVRSNRYLMRSETDYITKALEEVQQYRAIGTPEECLRNKDFLDFLADKMNPNDFETYLRLYNALEEKGCEE